MAPLPATYAFEDDDEDDDTFALRPTENKVTSDMTNVDFEYADSDEVAGTAEIIASLTQEEQKAMPDEFMALRHYRAEKVRLMCFLMNRMTTTKLLCTKPFLIPYVRDKSSHLILKSPFLNSGRRHPGHCENQGNYSMARRVWGRQDCQLL